MTELSFLVDLLLNHKLTKATRDAVAQRIQMVEASMVTRVITPSTFTTAFTKPVDAAFANQAPSMQAIMARNPDLVRAGVTVENLPLIIPPAPEPPPVAVVAQTPAAVQAMNSRNQAIAESMAGKVDKTTGRPRKF